MDESQRAALIIPLSSALRRTECEVDAGVIASKDERPTRKRGERGLGMGDGLPDCCQTAAKGTLILTAGGWTGWIEFPGCAYTVHYKTA